MPGGDDSNIEKRIEKDITMFYSNLDSLKPDKEDRKIGKLVEMSKMYASDAKSYLAKKDFYTSFSCISYAHGILDAVKELLGD